MSTNNLHLDQARGFTGAQRSSSDGSGGWRPVPAPRQRTLRPFEASRLAAYVAALLLLCAGCQEKNSPSQTQSVPAKHQHVPPHHGTPVVLGKEEYHLELVRDEQAGKLQAYVLDGEMENFVRIKQTNIDATVTHGGVRGQLEFKAVPNHATGEALGDTSLFQAQADWLKTESNFDLTIDELIVRGSTYRSIEFNFPKGNDADEK